MTGIPNYRKSSRQTDVKKKKPAVVSNRALRPDLLSLHSSGSAAEKILIRVD